MVTRKLKLTSVTDPPAETQTELRQRIRSQSFSDAALAVEWLNDAKVQRSKAYRHVLAVRQELDDLRAEIDRLSQERGSAVRVRDLAELGARADKLDRLFGRYRFKPEMNFSRATGIWALDMVPIGPSGPQVEVSGYGFAFLPRRIVVSEPVVVAALARLAAKRELYKVRLCETCGNKWRVSERKMDRFCSQECREAFQVKSPDYKARKAANQRKYRENLKQAAARGVSFK